jgi:putative transposase
MYYRPTKAPAKVKAALAEPIKAMIEAEPSFGYRTVANLLDMNKNTVQRIFQLKGWQVRKQAVGNRPRIEAKVWRRSGRTNDGRRTCVAGGAAGTAGWCSRW